MARLPKNIL